MFNYRLHASSERNPEVKQLKNTLVRWINGLIYDQNVVVRDLIEDLADGQVLLTFLSKLSGEAQNIEVGVTDKIKSINVGRFFKYLESKYQLRYPEEIQTGIMKKDCVSVIKVLVDLSKKVPFPYKLPGKVNFQIAISHDEEVSGVLKTKTTLHTLDLTRSNDETPSTQSKNEVKAESLEDMQVKKPQQPDPFDLIFEAGQEKINIAINSIKTGLNKHLSSMGYSVDDLSQELQDGVLLIFLLGCSARFFIPLYNFKMGSSLSESDKAFNVTFVIKHLREMGIDKEFSVSKIVSGDLKETMRLSYAILKLDNKA